MRSNQAYKLLTATGTINKMKRKHVEVRRRIFANDATNKGLIPKTHKQLIQLNDKKQTTQLKMGRRPEQTPLQRRQTSSQHRRSASLTIREVQVKTARETAVRCHLTPVKAASIKTCKQQVRRCGGKGNLLHGWWECRLAQSLWKTVRKFLKPLKIE